MTEIYGYSEREKNEPLQALADAKDEITAKDRYLDDLEKSHSELRRQNAEQAKEIARLGSSIDAAMRMLNSACPGQNTNRIALLFRATAVVAQLEDSKAENAALKARVETLEKTGREFEHCMIEYRRGGMLVQGVQAAEMVWRRALNPQEPPKD